MAGEIRNMSQELIVNKPKPAQAYLVQASDWNILNKMIKRILPTSRFFSIAYSACFGVATSSFLSMIPNYKMENEHIVLAFWIYLVIGIAALICGFVSLCIDLKQKEYVQESSKSVTEWMDDMKNKFENNET